MLDFAVIARRRKRATLQRRRPAWVPPKKLQLRRRTGGQKGRGRGQAPETPGLSPARAAARRARRRSPPNMLWFAGAVREAAQLALPIRYPSPPDSLHFPTRKVIKVIPIRYSSARNPLKRLPNSRLNTEQREQEHSGTVIHRPDNSPQIGTHGACTEYGVPLQTRGHTFLIVQPQTDSTDRSGTPGGHPRPVGSGGTPDFVSPKSNAIESPQMTPDPQDVPGSCRQPCYPARSMA